MTAKHTPGPWSLHEHMGGIWTTECEEFTAHSAAFGAGEILIGEIFGTHYKPGYVEGGYRRVNDFKEVEANARLIAAAPELLAALECFLAMYIPAANSGDWGNWNPEEDPEVIAARAAIAKATGEQS